MSSDLKESMCMPFFNFYILDLLTRQSLSAGAIEIVKRDKRRRKLARVENSCCLFVYGELYYAVADKFYYSRTLRIMSQIFVFCFNLLLCCAPGVLYYMVMRCRSPNFDEPNSDEEDGAAEEKDTSIYDQEDPQKNKHISLSVTQVELLKKDFNLTPIQVQKGLIDLNTYLFTELHFKEYDEQYHAKLNIWNGQVSHLIAFVERVHSGFMQELARSPQLKKIYRGEYNEMIPNIRMLQNMDLKMQELQKKLSVPVLTYSSGAVILPDLLPPQRISQFMMAYQDIQDLSVELSRINEHSLNCIMIPENYLVKLPNHAKHIMSYHNVLQIANKTIDVIPKQEPRDAPLVRAKRSNTIKNADVTTWLQDMKENTETKLVIQFLEANSINYNLICEFSPTSTDTIFINERNKLVKFFNQCEKLQALWEEKKAKMDDNCKKLSTIKDIIKYLRPLVRNCFPNFTSELTYAKMCGKEDVANMIRVWFCELLAGRSSILRSEIDKVIKAHRKRDSVMVQQTAPQQAAPQQETEPAPTESV